MPSAACFTILHVCVCVCVCVCVGEGGNLETENSTRCSLGCARKCGRVDGAAQFTVIAPNGACFCVERALSILFLASVSKRAVVWDGVARYALGVRHIVTSLYKQLKMYASSGNSRLCVIGTIINCIYAVFCICFYLFIPGQTDGVRKRSLKVEAVGVTSACSKSFLQLRQGTVGGSACQQSVAIK